MRKRFYYPAVLVSLVFMLLALATSSVPLNQSAAPVQTVSANGPVGAAPASAACRMALLLPGHAGDYASLQTGVRAAATQNGCQLDVYAAGGQPEDMAAQLHQAVQKHVTGLLVEPLDQADGAAAIQQAGQAGLPVVVIGAAGLPALHTTRVVPDFIGGARQAASFLCRAVHEQGTIVQLVDSRIDGADGLVSQAFSDGIQASCPAAKVITELLQASGAEPAKAAMLQVLSANPDISAVFAYNDSTMEGVFDADLQAGIMGVATSDFGDFGQDPHLPRQTLPVSSTLSFVPRGVRSAKPPFRPRWPRPGDAHPGPKLLSRCKHPYQILPFNFHPIRPPGG